jgi:hypothetical protein
VIGFTSVFAVKEGGGWVKKKPTTPKTAIKMTPAILNLPSQMV